MLTRFGLRRIMLQTFQTRSKVRQVVAVQLSYAVGVDGLTLSSKPSAVIALDGLKPYYCNKCVIATLIQILEYCVCQHYRSRDDTEAQRLDCLRSGRYNNLDATQYWGGSSGLLP